MKRAWNGEFWVEDPHSAIGAWVEGHWKLDPSNARKNLRAPIFVDHDLSALDHAILKVHAKRIRRAPTLTPLELAQRVQFSQIGCRLPERSTSDRSARHSQDREVWAEAPTLLPGERIQNSNAQARLHHAEWNLLCVLATMLFA
jgi:hypothetical protein